MDELEIVAYLKENKTNGVVYDFMPPDVRRWCEKHHDEFIFECYHSCDWHGNCAIGNGNYVYSLPDDYEQEPQFKPHYEEFDVDKNGFFRILKESESIYYHWFNWQKFIEENFDKYNNFGGWLYDKLWSTNVLMTDIDRHETCVYSGKDKNVVPVTPTKIKFWRYRE